MYFVLLKCTKNVTNFDFKTPNMYRTVTPLVCKVGHNHDDNVDYVVLMTGSVMIHIPVLKLKQISDTKCTRWVNPCYVCVNLFCSLLKIIKSLVLRYKNMKTVSAACSFWDSHQDEPWAFKLSSPWHKHSIVLMPSSFDILSFYKDWKRSLKISGSKHSQR